MESVSELFRKIEESANIHESLRDVIFSTFRSVGENVELSDSDPNPKFDDPRQLVLSKREELHEIVSNLDQHIQGKSEQEVAMFFSSLLDIYNQLYQYSTNGVVSIKIQPIQYITPPRDQIPPPIFYTEITMVYTPEEIRAIQSSLDYIDKKHPLYRFFIGILDQAFDVNHFNEVSSFLLLEIANYLIHRLENSGKAASDVLEDFRSRHERLSRNLDKTVKELLQLEVKVNDQITKYPAISLIPNLVRSLILIKLGLVPVSHAPEIIKKIGKYLKTYNQSKRIVAYDFNLLKTLQEELLRKQQFILKLQSDILNYTALHAEEGFAVFLLEYERIILEVETKTAQLDPKSNEYQKALEQKSMLEIEYQKRRRELNVLECQKSLAEVQKTMVESALTRFNEEGSVHGRIYEVLKGASKYKINIEKPELEKKESIHRMVTAAKRDDDTD